MLLEVSTVSQRIHDRYCCCPLFVVLFLINKYSCNYFLFLIVIGTTIFHPAGTCKMGSSTDPMAVVDSKLRVHGISGLRIADCGIMPTIVSGNTSAPTMAIGGICAQILSSEDK